MKHLEKAECLTKTNLDNYTKAYLDNNLNNVVRHAMSNVLISDLAYHKDHLKNNELLFDIEIKTMPVTNQYSSGRCWIFAACNVLREIIGKNLNISNFELSQSYVAFYDRLEKINYELESIIDLIDREHDDRTLAHILENGLCDGGQWDMFVNIVKKYGIVPKQAMPETFQSSNTGLSNNLINACMRKFAATAKTAYLEKGIDEVRRLKDELFQKFYNLLLDCHGLPCEKFDFEYRDANNEYHIDKDLTPISFYEKYIGNLLDDYVSVINAPTKDKPYFNTYTISYLGNVIEGKRITHLNVPMERLTELALTQIKNGEVTWFGSDCGKYAARKDGIWDDLSFDYQSLFNLDYDFSKTDGLDYKASVMNHAMVLTGVALKDNQPTKWKVENSWGAGAGINGYYVMTNTWFNRFVFQIVINKKYLKENELKAFEKEPILLKPWDPMGSLAD